MPDESTTSAPIRRIPRRTLAKGTAWAVPVVATVAAAPAYAKSGVTLPPCVKGITNDSVNWIVDNAIYTGCTKYCDHRDVRLTFHIAACDTPVTIRVSNVEGNSQWCAWNSGIGTLTKTVAANTAGTLTFPNTGDKIVGNGSCTITAYPNVNDGMHINPCTDGPYFKYEVFYSATATGTPAATGTWGDASNPPKANLATLSEPTGLTLCRTKPGTAASYTVTAQWAAVAGATSYEVSYRSGSSYCSTSTSGTGWSTAATVNSPTTTWTSSSASGFGSCTQVRVRAMNECAKSSYTGIYITAGTTTTCGGARSLTAEQDSLDSTAQTESTQGADTKATPSAEAEPEAPATAQTEPLTPADAPAADAPVSDAPAEG